METVKNKVKRKCSSCGSLRIALDIFPGESRCLSCGLHKATEGFDQAILFDVLTASTRVLAENLVECVEHVTPLADVITKSWKSLILPRKSWDTRDAAIDETVRKLEEVVYEKERNEDEL